MKPLIGCTLLNMDLSVMENLNGQGFASGIERGSGANWLVYFSREMG